MKLALILLGGGLLTYAIRLSFILLLGKMEFPHWLIRSLRFVPVAVFSALIFQLVFIKGDEVVLSPSNPRLLSAIIAGLIAWRSRNVILTILVGMVTLFILQVIFSII